MIRRGIENLSKVQEMIRRILMVFKGIAEYLNEAF